MEPTLPTYHDYVIRDGQFIGRFEDMYKTFTQPWRQDEQPNPYARQAGIFHMKRFGIRSVLECGSGLGYYSQEIYMQTGIVPLGLDVSPTAVDKASAQFPHLRFAVDSVDNLANYTGFDAILFAELTWYVLPQLPQLFTLMQEHFPSRYFINNLVFYKGTQRYGNEYFTSLAEFIRYVPFQMVGYCEASLESDSTIETSTIFRITPK
jgi:SAM-dependent methyltransferase